MNIKEQNNKILKPILIELVNQDLKEGKMIRELGICLTTWSNIRNGKRSPKIEIINLILDHLGLEMTITKKSQGND